MSILDYQKHTRQRAKEEADQFRSLMAYNTIGSNDPQVVEEAVSKTAMQDARATFEFAKELSLKVPKNRIVDIEKTFGTEVGMWVILELNADYNAIKKFFVDELTELSSIIQRMQAEYESIKDKTFDDEDFEFGDVIGAVMPNFDTKPKLNAYKGRLYLFLVLQNFMREKPSKGLEWADEKITAMMLNDLLHTLPNEILGNLFFELGGGFVVDHKQWKKMIDTKFATAFLDMMVEITKASKRKK